jgi:hypothetical protein
VICDALKVTDKKPSKTKERTGMLQYRTALTVEMTKVTSLNTRNSYTNTYLICKNSNNYKAISLEFRSIKLNDGNQAFMS